MSFRRMQYSDSRTAFSLLRRCLFCALAVMMAVTPAVASDRHIVLQATTSTQNSGLFDYLLPIFRARSGIEVRVVAVGTGQALKNARNGDGDAVLVHAREAEDRFVQEGWGIERRDVMANDFVIVGPAEDPARVGGLNDATAVLSRVARAGAPFASRGDNSGTHMKERDLWRGAGIDPTSASGDWYRETGAGMGATLNAAVGMNAYVLTDRATWVAFGNKANHKILSEGDKRLSNPYGIILVNPKRHPHVNAADAHRFADWLTGPEGQAAIAQYHVDGQQLFFPNAQN